MSETYGNRSVSICLHCDQVIVDGREDSGANEYDPMTLDGDFGCDESPESTDDGVGPHEPRNVYRHANKGALPTDWDERTVTFKVLV